MLAAARRFLLSFAGPASVAVSSFLVALLLLQVVPAADFGLFAFIQIIVTGIGYSLSNAALASPLLIALNRQATAPAGTEQSFALANAVLSAAGAGVVFLILLSLDAAPQTAGLFAASAFLLWIRWFARAFAFVRHRPALVAVSDAAYAVAFTTGVAVAWNADVLSLHTVAALQTAAALLGLLTIGPAVLRSAVAFSSIVTQPFRDGFAQHGRHALMAAASTEATANSHAYLVTFLLGPAAFAPLATAALFFRPVTLVLQSLIQLERPVIAERLRDGKRDAVSRTIWLMRLTSLVAWGISAVAACIVVRWFLSSLLHEAHDTSQIAAATSLWAVIFGLRCLRVPETSLLQADGQFRQLSQIMLAASAVTLPLVALLAILFGPVAALLGIMVGEAMATLATFRLTRQKVALT